MSSYIHNEMFLFLQAVLTGAALLFCYDLLRVARNVIPHCAAAVAVEDLLYWVGCGAAVFAGVYRSNQGILRFFLFFGVGLGVWLCYLTVSAFFVKICTRILAIPAKLLKFLIKWLLFPVIRCKIFVRKCVIKGRLASWLNSRKKVKKRE